MFSVLLFTILLLENVYFSTQQIEEALDDSLADVDNITAENDTSVDDVVSTYGNVGFAGQANAKGSVKIYASSGGSTPVFQSASFSEPFGDIISPAYYPFSSPAYSLGYPISPLFFEPYATPATFLSTFSYPLYTPYLATKFQATQTNDVPQLMLRENIQIKLSNIKNLPTVLIPNIATDKETVCPMVEPVMLAFTLCPKMVVTSPIAIRLGPFEFGAIANSNYFTFEPLVTNVDNVASLLSNSLSVKPSLELRLPGDLDGTNTVPINIYNTNRNIRPIEDTSCDFNTVNNFYLKEVPVSNLQFSGIVPVAGSFKIFAKF